VDTVGIIGLGYVGLPLAVEFGKKIKTIGYDIKKSRIDDLRRNNDLANQLSKKEIKKAKRLFFTDDFNKLSKCNYIIITLPTPVKKNKTPDLDNIKITCKKLSKLITIITKFENSLLKEELNKSELDGGNRKTKCKKTKCKKSRCKKTKCKMTKCKMTKCRK